MKRIVLFRLASLVLGLFATHSVLAVAYPQDDAAKSVYTNGWYSGTNGGTGFAAWVLTNTVTDTANFSGFFIGDSGVAAVNVTNKSFAMYANGAGNNVATAYRTINIPLSAGTVFTFKFKNNSVANNGVAGFSLGNSGSFGPSLDFTTLTSSARFSFYFVGGSTDYTIYDGNVTSDSGVPWTSGGLTIEFALRTADTYRVTIKSADGSTVLASFDNQPLQGSGVIDSFAVYAINTGSGGDVDVNQFSVVPVSAVPPVIQNVLPSNGSFYLPTSQAITFTASSVFSGISTNNITVTLNGTNTTSMAFTGSATNWAVTASPALVPNMIYNTRITVTDTNGNQTVNTLTFNTWSASDMFIEAEDYNYTGGHYIPSPALGAYAAFTSVPGSNTVDYLEYGDPTNTMFGVINPYRPLDPIWFELSGDTADHANFQAHNITNWAMGFISYGEWENYTRRITNGAYNVYARMSGGGTSPVMLMECDANSTATTTNQPRAAMGTFVGVDTFNVSSNFAFVPLRDFFSSNVVVRFSTNGYTTNTFRLTDNGSDSYNFDYLIFVPVSIAITNTQRPYISAGYPYPNASGVMPDQAVSFTIANRDSTVAPATVKLLVNGADVSASLVLSNNTAGTIATYQPSSLFALNTNSTLTVIFADNYGVSQTNTWQFTTANVLLIPTSYALTGTVASNGFNVHLVKAPDNYPANVIPQVGGTSSAWAEAMLAGTVVYTNGGSYISWDTNVFYVETNTLNYQICGTNSPDGYTFTNAVVFPYVPISSYSPCANTNGPQNFALAATMYVQLNAGLYQWAVRSDDGFRLATGTGSTPTNTLIMDYEGGRGAGTPSVFNFIVQTNGVYPMRLLYYQGGFGGSVQFYSIDRITGQALLINDSTATNSIKAYQSFTASGVVTLLNPQHSGSSTTFSFVTQSGKTHTVQYKTALTNATWQLLQTVAGNGSTTNITDAAASGASRFYRVSTQ